MEIDENDIQANVAKMRLLKESMQAAKVAKKKLKKSQLAADEADEKLSKALEEVQAMRVIYILRESDAEAYLYAARKLDPDKVNGKMLLVVQDLRAYALLKYELEGKVKIGPWVNLVDSKCEKVESIPDDIELKALYDSVKKERTEAQDEA